MLSHLVEHTRGVTVVRLQGRLDQSGCDVLAQVLDRHAAKRVHVVLDMRNVDYLSSAAVSLLIRLASDVAPGELRLALAAVQSHVAEILTIANLGKILPMYRSVADAVYAVAPAATIDPEIGDQDRARAILLRYLMMIQYGSLEHLDDVLHLDVEFELASPDGIEHINGIHALRLHLNAARSSGGIDIEIGSIVAQSDAASAWIIERANLTADGDDGLHCAILATLRGDKIARLHLLRSAPLSVK